MPQYTISEVVCEIARGTFLLDTNVLVAGFDRTDKYFTQARDFLEEVPVPPIVPMAVVVEAWGVLVGRSKQKRFGLELVEWIRTPGKALVLPQVAEAAISIDDLVRLDRVDCVDALIVELAIDIKRQFGAGQSVVVVTYDTADFTNCMLRRGIKLELLDLRTL